MQTESSSFRAVRRNGFTLLEVLVALAILAISAGAIITQVSQITRQTATLEAQSQALWIAENQLSQQLARGRWPKRGESSTVLTLAQREWLVVKTIEDTNNPALRRIDINVSLNNQDHILASLRGYQGKQ